MAKIYPFQSDHSNHIGENYQTHRFCYVAAHRGVLVFFATKWRHKCVCIGHFGENLAKAAKFSKFQPATLLHCAHCGSIVCKRSKRPLFHFSNATNIRQFRRTCFHNCFNLFSKNRANHLPCLWLKICQKLNSRSISVHMYTCSYIHTYIHTYIHLFTL